MKCAVAIVLALVSMVVANPVPPLGYGYGYGYGSPLLYPSAVSVSSSVINHGLTIPKVVAPVYTAPIIKTVIPTVVKTPLVTSLGWDGWSGYGLGGWGHDGAHEGGHDLGWGGYGLGWGGKGWH